MFFFISILTIFPLHLSSNVFDDTYTYSHLYIYLLFQTSLYVWSETYGSVVGQVFEAKSNCIHDSVEFQAAPLQAYVPKLTIRQILAIFYVP